MKRIRHILEYWLVVILIFIVSLISWQGLSSFSKFIAHLIRVLLPRRDRVARDNIKRSLLSGDEEAKELSLESFKNITLTILELIKLSSGEPAGDHIIFTRYQPVEEVYAEGRGGILISAHLGNWEILAKRLVELGYSVSVLVRAQTNPLVERLFREMRERCGVKVLYTGVSAREIMGLLKKGEFVAILIDQDAGSDGVFYPFFGRLASWEAGPARMAGRLGVPILMGFDLRLESGEHIAQVYEPLYLVEDEVDRFFKIYIDELEGLVRMLPGEYHWLHNRWRSSPDR